MSDKSDRMPPWKEITYFQPPLVSTVVVSPTVWTPLVSANPNRVGLWLSGPSGTGFTTDPTIGTSAGLVLGNSQGSFHFTEAVDGPLCTSAWFATGNGVATAVEVILREWPQ